MLALIWLITRLRSPPINARLLVVVVLCCGIQMGTLVGVIFLLYFFLLLAIRIRVVVGHINKCNFPQCRPNQLAS